MKTRYLSDARMFHQNVIHFRHVNDSEKFIFCRKYVLKKPCLFPTQKCFENILTRKYFEQMTSLPDAKMLCTKDVFPQCGNALKKGCLSPTQKWFGNRHPLSTVKIFETMIHLSLSNSCLKCIIFLYFLRLKNILYLITFYV